MAEYIGREAAKKACAESETIPRYSENNRPVTDEILDSLPAVSVPQWISVKDRLPEAEENPVLAGSTELHYVNMAWYHPGKRIWETPSGFSCSFTHWMPLPKPPKGENDG